MCFLPSKLELYVTAFLFLRTKWKTNIRDMCEPILIGNMMPGNQQITSSFVCSKEKLRLKLFKWEGKFIKFPYLPWFYGKQNAHFIFSLQSWSFHNILVISTASVFFEGGKNPSLVATQSVEGLTPQIKRLKRYGRTFEWTMTDYACVDHKNAHFEELIGAQWSLQNPFVKIVSFRL